MNNVIEIMKASGLAYELISEGATKEELNEVAELIYGGQGISDLMGWDW